MFDTLSTSLLWRLAAIANWSTGYGIAVLPTALSVAGNDRPVLLAGGIAGATDTRAALGAGAAGVVGRLCAAIVCRINFGGNIIETGTRPCRLAHTRNQKSAATG